jgi:uncharacterized repeat protein (TIGR01451 family)
MKMTNQKKRGIGISLRILFAVCGIGGSPFLIPAEAVAAVTSVTPNTWNTLGLDSNTPGFGPNRFPVGARVCSDAAGTVPVTITWDPGGTETNDANIYLRSGSLGTIGNPLNLSFSAPGCLDAYFEVEVNKTSAAFDKTRRYHITAGGVSTPTPRELYVEHLISQSRNGIDDVKLNGVSVAAGGAMNLVVGNSYTIELDGHTAPGGYNQFEEFINFPNTIFQVQAVTTTYSSLSIPSPYVSSPNPGLYADACLWENNPYSPNYRSCYYDYKAGSTVITTYAVKIVSGGGTSQTLNTLLYDFSGSSFHYNSDYSTGARIANIIDPTSTAISKSFSPNTSNVGGVSTLTFTLTNPNAGGVSGLGFTDVFPTTPGAMTLYDTVTTNTCGGTLTNNLSGALAAGSLGIKLSGATVAANSSCIIQVNVTANAAGTYNNTSQNLLVNSLDTGKNASATLTVSSAPLPPPPPSSCTNPVTMATWTMEGPPTVPPAPLYTGSLGPDVLSATASYVTVSGAQAVANNLGAPNNTYAWGGTAPTGGDGWKETYSSRANGFQFVLDTSKYGGVTISFDGIPSGNGWANPNSNVFVNTKADSGSFTCYGGATGPYPQSAKNSWTSFTNIPAATTGTGTTTFLIGVDGSGNGKTNAIYYMDNVTFKGCPVPLPPTMTKSFATNPVAVGGTSTLTFTITNPNACCALSGIAFADILPLNSLQGTVAVTNASPTVTGTGTAFKTQLVANSSFYINKVVYTVSAITSDTQLTLTANYAGATASGLTITSGLTLSGAPSTTCTGGTVTTTTDAATGASVINLANGTIAAGAGTTCTVTATVKDSIAGPISNVSGAVTSTSSGSVVSTNGVARATLTAVLPPAISKLFAPNPIQASGTSTLTFRITNPNQNNAVSGVAFSDPFPATMTVAAPATYSTAGCGTPTFAPLAGAGSLNFTNGTIAGGGTCTVTVQVTATATGTNTSANVSHIINAATVNGNTATDTLTITPPHPAISLLKQVSNSATGPWYDYVVVTGGNVYYKFTVENPGDVDLSTVYVSDPDFNVAGQVPGCSWATLAKYSTATCTAGPVSPSGSHQNNATADGMYGGTHYTGTDFAIYATPGLTIAKSVTETSFTSAGNVLHYSYTVTNSGSAILDGPVTVTDDKTTVTCPAVNTVGDLDNYLDPGEALTCTATYTVTAADVTAKQVTNTASASTTAGEGTPAVTSSSVSKTVPLAPDLTATKTNNVGGTAPTNVFIWTLTVANTTAAGTAAFTNGQVLLTDDLPSSGATYALGSVTKAGATGTINCAIVANTLTCTASGGVAIPPALQGTVSVTNGSAAVTGAGTLFTTQLTAGSVIAINGVSYTVSSIANDTQLTLSSNYAGATAGGLVIPASFSVPVTVTTSTAGPLVNPRSGGACKADPANALVEISKANNDCADTVTIGMPLLSILKSANKASANPGEIITYTVQLANTGNGVGTNVVLRDDLSPYGAFGLNAYGAGVRFSFTDSSPASGLSLGAPVYSNDSGATWGYTPVSGGGGAPAGYDGNITNWRIPMTGTIRAGGSFTLNYQIVVK